LEAARWGLFKKKLTLCLNVGQKDLIKELFFRFGSTHTRPNYNRRNISAVVLKSRGKRTLVQNVGQIGTTGQPVQTLWHHRLVLLGQQFEKLFLLSSVACPSNMCRSVKTTVSST